MTNTIKIKIAVIGCIAFSQSALTHLLGLPEAEIVGIVTRAHSSINSDFCSLKPLADAHKIPCFLAEGNDQTAMANFLRQLSPDIIFCLGWSYLLHTEILHVAPKGVVGYHPAALPKNRGRHPLIWALALGLTETASSFFLMDDGANSGPILDQKTLAIGPDDTAQELYDRTTSVALDQLTHLTRALASGKINQQPQDNSKANIWRKRGKKDGEIDWRMSAASIHNLVRALTRPYVGAHCVIGAREPKIWRARLAGTAAVNLEPGRILMVEGKILRVKCGDAAAIDLLEHEIDPLPQVGDCI